MRIIDPVNPKNNAAQLYTRAQADLIIEAAMEAGDAISLSTICHKKEDSLLLAKKKKYVDFNL